MTLMHRAASIIRWILQRDRAEQDLDRELQTFVELAAAERIREGVPPEEARRQARLTLGGVEQTKERVRSGRHGAWLDEIGRDVRYACRLLIKQRGFSAVVVLTLALGIGANTSIFSLIDALLLRWLPVPNPQELVQVTFAERGQDAPQESFSYAMVGALAGRDELFASAMGFSSTTFNVGAPGALTRVRGALVTGQYYDTLGLQPSAGRLLRPDDDRPGAPLGAVISHSYWERHYAGSPAAVGQPILTNGVPVPIVGVSPPGFTGANVGAGADITMTIASLAWVEPDAIPLLSPGNFWLRVLARPARKGTMSQTEAQLASVWAHVIEPVLAPHWPASQRAAIVEARPRLSSGGTGWTYLREIYSKPLFVLMGIVAVVLLIACANVASLLLARATSRQREIAIRLAIGASRGRVVRQLLIEDILLSLTGAAVGMMLAWYSGNFLVNLIALAPGTMIFDLEPNWRVLGFTAAIAVVTALAFGVVPALHATASGPFRGLKDTARIAAPRSRLLSSLVSAQVALSLVLLVGAALFVRTLQNLHRFDPGFSSEGVLLVDLASRRTPVPGDVLEDLRLIRGVRAASMSTHTPLSGSRWSEPAVPAGQPIPERDTATFVGIAPGFFDTMGMQLLSGRDFSPHDGPQGPAVAIVNERFAQRVFPGKNPIGQHLAATVRGQARDLEIVGLAKNSHSVNLRTPPAPTVYVAYAQSTRNLPTTIEVRAAGALGQIASAVQQSIQRRFPHALIEVRGLSQQVELTMVRERMLAKLAGAFSALAVLLAAIGLYGLLAYRVTQRTKEIGIRMAIGAQRTQVIGLVLQGAALLVIAGIAVGVPATWAASRWIESMLFGLEPTDPGAIALSIVVVAVAALGSAYLPAWRASRVDPLPALRHE